MSSQWEPVLAETIISIEPEVPDQMQQTLGDPVSGYISFYELCKFQATEPWIQKKPEVSVHIETYETIWGSKLQQSNLSTWPIQGDRFFLNKW